MNDQDLQEDKTVTPNMDDPKPKIVSKRKISFFEYPALPRFEIGICFIITICTFIYAWYQIYVASRTYTWKSFAWEKNYYNVGHYKKDNSNPEWYFWKIFIRKMMIWFFGHAILFNFGETFLSNRLWKLMMIVYWILAHVFIAGKLLTGVAIIQGLLVYTFGRLTKSKILVWIVSLGFLHWSTTTYYLITSDGMRLFMFVLIFPYKALQYLTFCIEMLEKRKKSETATSDESNEKSQICSRLSQPFLIGLYDMFWYAFYLPYFCYAIVTYKHFPKQLADRAEIKNRNWKEILIFGLRLIFWIIFTELILYFFYFGAMMNNLEYLKSIRKDTLLAIGYACGQFFHLKYVAIFGVTSYFARMDKMQPLPGPICGTRVALYSKIWRNFDRGLYDFFKDYIFIPICQPTFSVGRKIFGTLASYAFVLFWHGFTHQYLVWVSLNILELFLEAIGKAIYGIPSVRSCREKYISDRNFRRLLGWIQIIPYQIGTYSMFYFLGSSKSGWIFVNRILWQGVFPVQWPFILYICLVYCLMQVSMEIERWQSQKVKTVEEGKKEN